MSRTKIPGSPPGDLTPPEAKARRYRLELSFAGIIGYGLGLVALCTWVFVLGVMVGGGVRLVNPQDFSLKGELLRFMGLGKEIPPPPEDFAETWESPQKMMESLRYYEDLTQKGNHPSGGPPSQPSLAPAQPSPATPHSSTQAAPPTHPPIKAAKEAKEAKPPPPPAPPVNTPPPLSSVGQEHFTILVASLRDQDNLKRLVEQLRTKGYSPRVEPLDLKEGGKWNRVLVGTFANREEALRFMNEFNRKEHLEGMVMRETRGSLPASGR